MRAIEVAMHLIVLQEVTLVYLCLKLFFSDKVIMDSIDFTGPWSSGSRGNTESE
jgi:hypothetical protein